ncbi:hypothetical protein KY285_036926 [Solanum tuberosum]|nr:hypothetical protein KY285_036926 [Solanum tuberosum]
MQSESSEQVRSVVAAADTRGKHRISAELKRLEQETRFLEEELELLDKMEKASAACKDLETVDHSTPSLGMEPIVQTPRPLFVA